MKKKKKKSKRRRTLGAITPSLTASFASPPPEPRPFQPGQRLRGVLRGGEGVPGPRGDLSGSTLAARDPRQTPAAGRGRTPAPSPPRWQRPRGLLRPGGTALPTAPDPRRAPRDSPEISAWGTPLRLKPLAPYSCRTSAQLLALLPLSLRAGAEATHSSQNPHGKKRILLRWPRHLPREGQSQGPAAGRRPGSPGRRGAGRRGVRARPPSPGSPGGMARSGRGRPAGEARVSGAAAARGVRGRRRGVQSGRRRGSAEGAEIQVWPGLAALKPRSVTA